MFEVDIFFYVEDTNDSSSDDEMSVLQNGEKKTKTISKKKIVKYSVTFFVIFNSYL